MAICNDTDAVMHRLCTDKCSACGNKSVVYWQGHGANAQLIELCDRCVIEVCGALVADAGTIHPPNAHYFLGRFTLRFWEVCYVKLRDMLEVKK